MAGTTISSWLIKQYQHEAHPEQNPNFVRDAKLLIVAGSDTTAVTLTWLFYELANHPDQQAKIRKELLQLGLVPGRWSDKDIAHCEHLNAAINETLRLHSPGPSGIFRVAPKEGLQVGKTYLPGGTVFNIPTHTMNREESVYADASTFVPERWTTRPDMVKHKKCFTPFLLGQHSCIGRNLAMQEMRTLTAQLLLRYDVAFAPGEDGSRLEHDSKDHFTMSLAPLELVFTPVKV
ncbi:Cytochrome P450 monooxygenase lcsK [Fulvia fulva]|uniref:Cytochrome P450 monooxygenase lcsK n=1 Tax=Passalora fulva TaxID=5499 RepID=A0A9Q8PE02_PASFU|nr:Cytochrome P450 monooxygenase lcsK [Fulvia fulva]KAK4618147.1 Cytochrome P450 monooxygenase lcsK [Fulvia fulva]KAK4619230.1 Cytochrome P450 monooxygenase lcsK [Fulvia fulva]UJO20705.1 Cytochrome P450 monooxygenase lcsK [Fulvia fulva]WPV18576.1 Cytochrome P450 monooxygenase lcsK [Fulvia fulva]WPV33186.1 Cytochrome P450 monooxygenase lcsK [Fulvia fulva]